MQSSSKQSRQRLRNWGDKISDTLELPPSVLPGVPQLELSGNREAVVEGCKGILQYEESVIRLCTGRFVIRFTGTDLVIRSMQSGLVQICGTILSVDFT